MSALPPQITDATVTLTWGTAGRYYGYCTLLDVTYEFPNAAAFTKNLTPQAMGMEISSAAQEMQDQLDLVYVMPYTGTNTGILHTLRQINMKLAVANLIERIFQAAPSTQPSVSSVEYRHFAELLLVDILTGKIRWVAPFGDATARAEVPVYPTANLATIQPSPNAPDENDATPVFAMGRIRYRRSQAF